MLEPIRRRAFNAEEKREMYMRAGGRCSICRIRLGEDWHADHVHPFAMGGETTADNAQALCPDCNLRKGASMPSEDQESESRMREVRSYHYDGKTRSMYYENPHPLKFERWEGCEMLLPGNDKPVSLGHVCPHGYGDRTAVLTLAFGGSARIWERPHVTGSDHQPEFAVYVEISQRCVRMVYCQSLSDLLALLGELKPLER